MGYVDRHNRFRQDLLGLYRVWRTKSWQQRFITEFFGIAIVDAFLLARKFVPRWMNASTKRSVFWAFCNRLLPQMATFSDPDDLPEAPPVTECEPRLQGKYTVANGVHAGELRTKQQRCTYCKRAEPKRTKKDGRAIRTCYTCVAHPKVYMCKKGCWEEHLADTAHIDDSDADSDSRDVHNYNRLRSPNLPVNRRQTSPDRTPYECLPPQQNPPVTPGDDTSSSDEDMNAFVSSAAPAPIGPMPRPAGTQSPAASILGSHPTPAGLQCETAYSRAVAREARAKRKTASNKNTKKFVSPRKSRRK